MGCTQCLAAEASPQVERTGPKCERRGGQAWTPERAERLQETVDRVFGKGGDALLGLAFSFTMADPTMEGCPLIGCSTGFGALCGYEMREIVGRNCRFLIDPVPAEQQDSAMRRRAKDFCLAVRARRDYWVPASEWEPWMPRGRPGDELWCVQKNARKDGTLFNNMFILKVIEIGSDLGEEQPFIVGLQSELPAGKADLRELGKHISELDANMSQLIKIVASQFFVAFSMSRKHTDAHLLVD
mmetsp:Transcript_107516/g.321546  ORF Transcript_107516/g.321546 Transcript_107516/m.321546 type:complete len:242 (-) Transcript_107516:51-776(-)